MPLDFIFDDESTDGSRPRASSSFGKGRDWFESQRGASEHGIFCVLCVCVCIVCFCLKRVLKSEGTVEKKKVPLRFSRYISLQIYFSSHAFYIIADDDKYLSFQ